MDVFRLATRVLRSCGRAGGVIALAGMVGACGAPTAPPIAVRQQGLGEPTSGFPTPDERLGIMALNRARSDPSTIKGPQSTNYPARPPVQWSYALSRSSRFHATNMLKGNVTLMHSSPCTLNSNIATANCDGTPSCACSGGTIPTKCRNCADVADPIKNGCGSTSGNGTDTFTRIGYFTAGSSIDASGEIVASGYPDPISTVDGWMDEPAGDDGHRTNILDVGVSSNVMGYGRVTGSGCFDSYDVSDSGEDAAFQAVNLPTAAVSPSNGSAGSYTFYATWADSAGAPKSINVVVDSACTTMTKELGSDTLNATYKLATSLSAGCHTYRVVAYNQAGVRQAYPSTGSLTISAGSACSADYQATAPSAPCDVTSTAPDDLGDDLTDGGVIADAAGPNLEGADLGGGLIIFDLSNQGPVLRDSGCNVGAGRPGTGAGGLLLALLFLLRRRRLA
jgi:hypothetical protein